MIKDKFMMTKKSSRLYQKCGGGLKELDKIFREGEING